MNSTKLLAGKLAVVLCGTLLGYKSYAQPSVSVGVTVPTPSVGIVIHADSDFYEPLAPQGEWVTVGSYGRCWRPGRVEAGWRPYCHGNWELTDGGWYWMSDEPWAWATYHYGRWDFTDQYGWYWVPQTQWAPAWVSWHEGGGYVGWAPLQPTVSISVNGYVGFNQSHIPPRAFVFVEQRHFMEPVRPTTVVANNTTIINKTTVNITNTRIVNNTVINGGPTTTVIEKASGRKVRAMKVQELRHEEEAPVVARQKITPPPAQKTQKNVQTPVRNEVEPATKKPVAAPASSPAEKPAVTEHAPAPLTPTGRVKESEKAQPAPSHIEPRPAIKESTEPKAAKRAEPSIKQEARPENNYPDANKPTSGLKSDKHIEKEQESARPSDKSLPQRPVREGPAVSEKQESHPQDKHEEKIKD